MRRLLRTRDRNCSPSRAHPRRRLSWRSRPCRTPTSGCSSGNAKLARPSTGTDELERLSGSRRLASRWCGSARGLGRESTTGTETRVSPRLISLLFLLSEERDRQPRAVYKYWVGYLPSCDHAATCSSSSSSFMAGMDQKGHSSGMYKAGIVGHYAPRAVFFPRLAGPECFGILAGTYQKDSYALFLAWLLLLVTMHLALCPFPWLAGHECSAFWPVWTRRTVVRGVQWASAFSAQLGTTADTCSASVYEA